MRSNDYKDHRWRSKQSAADNEIKSWDSKIFLNLVSSFCFCFLKKQPHNIRQYNQTTTKEVRQWERLVPIKTWIRMFQSKQTKSYTDMSSDHLSLIEKKIHWCGERPTDKQATKSIRQEKKSTKQNALISWLAENNK